MNISTPTLPSSLPSTSDLPDLKSIRKSVNLPSVHMPSVQLDDLPDAFETIVDAVVEGAAEAAGRTQRALRTAQRRPKVAGAVLAGLVLVVLAVLIARRRRSDPNDQSDQSNTRVVRAA